MKKIVLLGCVTAVLAGFAYPATVTSAQKRPTHPHSRTATKGRASSSKKRNKKSTASSHRGQQKIDTQRAEQIQEALIREHYLTGKPTGQWDATTQQALQKYQADNGWQSKNTPDSRALIKLGLGPDHDHLLNPESAMTEPPRANTGAAASVPADSPSPQH